MDALSFVVGAVVGAFIGVLVDLLFRQYILRMILQVRRLLSTKIFGTDPTGGTTSHQLVLPGPISIDWVSIVGTGETPFYHAYIKNDLEERDVQLPEDLQTLHDQAVGAFQKKAAAIDSSIWNNKRFSLVEHHTTRYGLTEKIGLNCTFHLTDYANFYAITQQLDTPDLVYDKGDFPTTIRQKYFPRFNPEQPNKYVTHSFGIDLCVITKDHKIILVQRSGRVAIGKGLFSIPVDEGMLYPQDLDGHGCPSFVKAATRGLIEELGIDLDAMKIPEKKIEFLNFGALSPTNEYTMLGRIVLPLTSMDVEALYIEMAKDRELETRHELYAPDFLIEEVVGFVNSCRPWAHTAIAAIYYAMVREWGYWEVRHTLSRYKLSENIFVEMYI